MPAYNPMVGGMGGAYAPRSPVIEGNNGRAAKNFGAARGMTAHKATANNVALIIALSMGVIFALHYTGFRGTVTIGG